MLSFVGFKGVFMLKKTNIKGSFKKSEIFLPQTNGEISDSIVQNWTLQAYECYSIHCNCAKCSISKGHYSFICQMPKIVSALLKKQGKPDIRLIKAQQAQSQTLIA